MKKRLIKIIIAIVFFITANIVPSTYEIIKNIMFII